ncbi:MAG: glycoside hydrolase family 28 protein [Bacteroidetes bacterium]|nr:glycoside hydrolase family 28 protein [Bacteroidota bacterium]MBU1116951.1 glycoside hydrolase family 28 protein [Bacteroidota bacterium]MBU1799124.1 glycoside hydrolase family 28 protein [Bacteroidota bacterium]
MKKNNIIEFGAVGDGLSDNANAIQLAIDDCFNSGGGEVVVPANNIFMTGPFDLKSNVTLNVETNAILLANPDETVYKKSAFRENLGEGTIWIGGENAENIAITGRGTIDGNGIAFMGQEEKAAYVLKEFDVVDPRPHLLTLINIKNLLIRDVTFKNSAYWCLHIIGCDDVKIESVTILNNLKIRNSDGIDLDHSRNVRISNCYIESADDCICFKTRREYEEHGPTENVVVTNCIMTSTSCSIKLGSENMDAIRNVIVSNCIIKSSNRGIGIQNRDEGVVENILFDNIIIEGRLFDDVWWGKAEPIYITAYKRKAENHKDSNWRFAKGQTEGKVGKVSNIKFSNINCKSENGVFVGGEPGKVSDIQFTNIQLEINKTTKYKGNLYDLRPSDTVGLLETDIAGFYIDTASEIYLDNCKLKWGENKEPYYKHVTFLQNVTSLKIEKFIGQSASDDIESHKIINCLDVEII